MINDSYGDGLAGSTSGGSVDGNLVILDCDGNELWNLQTDNNGSVDFGYLYTSPQFSTGDICTVG